MTVMGIYIFPSKYICCCSGCYLKYYKEVNSPLALLFLLDIILSSSRSKQIELIRGSRRKLTLFEKFIGPFKTISSQFQAVTKMSMERRFEGRCFIAD